ncbi:MAG: hypothetical protein ACRYGG_21885, partial [Janthinobacterium lividum]
MEFKEFAAVVTKQFNKMASEGPLFKMDLQKNDLWDAYLASFPEGTNPLRKERTEHDCQTCKNFVRHAGGIVSIVDNRLVSVWDVEVEEPF